MTDFWSIASEYECFSVNKRVSQKSIMIDDKKIGFTMINSAPLSLLGGDYEDMGSHYLSNSDLALIEKYAENDINILVMHHSYEWLKSDCKDKLREIISKKYSVVLSGHEHLPFGQRSRINNFGEIQFIQGNALSGYAEEGNGFCSLSIDMNTMGVKGYSYLWKKDIYVPKQIIDSTVRSSLFGELILNDSFESYMSHDLYNRKIDDYYVFPGVTYDCVDTKKCVKHRCVENEKDFFEIINNKKRVFIMGEHKAGKSILAKKIFSYYYTKGKKPILLDATDICKKKIDKTIEYTFCEEYFDDEYSLEKYKQLPITNKVAIVDNANLIRPEVLDVLVDYLAQNMGQIIIFSEEKIELNLKKQVVDVLINDDEITFKIKPFLYDKRKELIGNILKLSKTECNIENETTKINDLINLQVKYFNLNPDFIISFVNQYESDINFKFMAGMNVFNIVYESSIKNSIILNSTDVDSMHVINVLRELAYIMHFEKKNSVKLSEIENVIEKYKSDYRQSVNIRAFINAVLNAKILLENENEYRFRDHTILAYFVAQALNQKYNQGEKDINDRFKELLKNLCFSVNSDIVLFLAFITNNPKFINIIIEGAQKHFDNQEELSIDKHNIEFILDTTIPIRESLPDKEERTKREKALAKNEEKVKVSDLIELVNEYDYTEDDLKKIENQVLISYKYLELLSKTLPAFCQNMKVEQQDVLVDLIYRCPDQFLFSVLKDINDNFDEYSTEIYNDISQIKRNRGKSKITLENVRNTLEQLSSILVMGLYRLVASTCTNEQSINAINAYDYNSNTNYKLQNLMMAARVDEINTFASKAKDLDKQLDCNLAKSIIRFTIRDYFVRNNNIEMHGEAQSLLDQFFSSGTRKNIQLQMAKNRELERKRK